MKVSNIIKFGTIFLIFLGNFYTCYSCDSTKSNDFENQEGHIILQELVLACKDIANSTSNKLVHKNIAGKVVKIRGKKYEIRFFSFEDTSGKLNKGTTFRKYVDDNSLHNMKSTIINPLAKIYFDSFDFRKVKLEDGVYFSMAVRLINDLDK